MKLCELLVSGELVLSNLDGMSDDELVVLCKKFVYLEMLIFGELRVISIFFCLLERRSTNMLRGDKCKYVGVYLEL